MAESRRIQAGGIAAAMGALAMGVALASPANAAPTCRVSTVSWSAPSTVLLFQGGAVTYDTGVSVPAAGPGETVSVTGSAYSSYDRYPANASPSRAEADQQHEQWGLRIGGTDFGLLTADVPDSPDEGAVDDWYATVSGSLGSGAVATGRIVIVHASQYGYTESYNSVRPGSFSLTVSYCSEAPATTAAPSTTTSIPATTATTTSEPTSSTSVTATSQVSTTTEPASTTTESSTTTTEPLPGATAAPTTTTAATSTTLVGSPTTLAVTTTSILPLTPLPASTTIATTTTVAGVTTSVVPSGPLPSTGWNGAVFLRVGAVLLAAGAGLYRLRRRALAAG